MHHLTLSLESMSGRSQSDPDVDGGPLNVQRHSGALHFVAVRVSTGRPHSSEKFPSRSLRGKFR